MRLSGMSLIGRSLKIVDNRDVRSMSQLLNTQQRLKRHLERLAVLIDRHKQRVEAARDVQKVGKRKPRVLAQGKLRGF